MANFNIAYNITIEYEGGYSNDHDDMGGETYKGISRVYHPNWVGWSIIDKLKNYQDFPINLENNKELDELVREFYKDTYWNLFLGDDLTEQIIANELFDTSVNMGVNRAIKFLQKGLNLLNRNQQNYDDIVEDGKFGSKTYKALSMYLIMNDAGYLYKVLNILQGMHYINCMTESTTQEKYARGWLKRVEFIKN